MKPAQRMTEAEYHVLLKHLEDAEYRINTKIYELDISCSLGLFEAFEKESLNIEQRIQALKDLYPDYNI